MEKITASDFSGGIQESTIPEDFSDRQWAQLKGFVPSSETMFESQWAIQGIGGATGFQAVWPLASSAGTFLVGIKTDGTIWWCKAPANNAGYATANSVSWSQITDSETVDWVAGGGTQPTVKIHPNPYYKFLTSVPFEIQKFVRSPLDASKSDVTKDTDKSGLAKGLASGVVIDTADRPDAVAFTAFNQSGTSVSLTVAKGHNLVAGETVVISHANGSSPYVSMLGVFTIVSISVGAGINDPDGIVFTSPVSATATAALNGTITPQSQALIAFVDTTGNGLVRVSTFPHYRRLPTHADTGSFINGKYLNTDDSTYSTNTMPTWPRNSTAGLYMHPYTYVDQYGTLLPGTGIIPRANVGAVKGSRLLLGDIEWRTKYATVGTYGTDRNCTNTSGSTEFDLFSTRLFLPSGVPDTARMLYNNGSGILYLKQRTVTPPATDPTPITTPYASGGAYVVTVTAKEVTVAGSVYTGILYFSAAHPFSNGDKIEIFNIDGRFNGMRTITAVTSTTISFSVSAGSAVAKTWLIADPATKAITGTAGTVTTKTTISAVAGNRIQFINVGFPFDGEWTAAAGTTGTTVNITFTTAPGDLSSTTISDVDQNDYPRVVTYDYRVEVGAYQAVPDTWTYIMAAASASGTTVLAAESLSLATHSLNDRVTGPFRGGMYFSTGDLDTFDPRAMLLPAKSDVRLAAIHVLDDTIVLITEKGSSGDGLLRIRGYLNRLISYSGTSDPNAVRIEVVRGGLGAPTRTSKTHLSYSCVWPDAGVVAFVDAGGGIYYTNGQSCDRFDRFGPKQPSPSQVSERDHVAAMGKHLFAYRHNGGGGNQRLLCFTVLSSSEGSGSGCWTEMVIPGEISNMVGSNDAMYFIYNTAVYRVAPSAPDSERGSINGVAQTQTVSTRTFGESGSHRRVNWHRFGMTFATPLSCTVGTVRVQGAGALGTSALTEDGGSDPVKHTTALNRTYNTPSVLGEFTVSAGIGPQAMASATVTFTGYVQLQSASFWVTGSEPRTGDK